MYDPKHLGWSLPTFHIDDYIHLNLDEHAIMRVLCNRAIFSQLHYRAGGENMSRIQLRSADIGSTYATTALGSNFETKRGQTKTNRPTMRQRIY
jgi:hypothetical protein